MAIESLTNEKNIKADLKLFKQNILTLDKGFKLDQLDFFKFDSQVERKSSSQASDLKTDNLFRTRYRKEPACLQQV